MSGYNALWVPGMDHAGIATQVQDPFISFAFTQMSKWDLEDYHGKSFVQFFTYLKKLGRQIVQCRKSQKLLSRPHLFIAIFLSHGP